MCSNEKIICYKFNLLLPLTASGNGRLRAFYTLIILHEILPVGGEKGVKQKGDESTRTMVKGFGAGFKLTPAAWYAV